MSGLDLKGLYLGELATVPHMDAQEYELYASAVRVLRVIGAGPSTLQPYYDRLIEAHLSMTQCADLDEMQDRAVTLVEAVYSFDFQVDHYTDFLIYLWLALPTAPASAVRGGAFVEMEVAA